MERFVAILLEHTAGDFPLWLNPNQAIVLSLSEKYEAYSQSVLHKLENLEVRALIDNRNETVGKKIREAETQKIPYMLIVGENEEKEGTVSVRKRGGEDLGSMTVEAFAGLVAEEVGKSMKQFKEV